MFLFPPQLCDTYPKHLFVPASASTPIILGSSKFRSRGRLPVLSYFHSKTQVSFLLQTCSLYIGSLRILDGMYLILIQHVACFLSLSLGTICWIKSSDQTITDHQEFFSSDVNPVLICEFLSHGLFDAKVFNVISIVMSKNPS